MPFCSTKECHSCSDCGDGIATLGVLTVPFSNNDDGVCLIKSLLITPWKASNWYFKKIQILNHVSHLIFETLNKISYCHLWQQCKTCSSFQLCTWPPLWEGIWILDRQHTFKRTRSPLGFSWGMSSAVAPDFGIIPMQSSSLIRQCCSPWILISVTPIPNLLYSTVWPGLRKNSWTLLPTFPSPTATISPAAKCPQLTTLNITKNKLAEIREKKVNIDLMGQA